ncbi:MAG: ATP-binding cassette domain-containing protein [Myxococcota bacterium]
MSRAAFEIAELRWEIGPDFRLEIPALTIPEGKTTVLLGPSASGKSTLLSLLGRVESGYFRAPAPAPTGRIVYRPPEIAPGPASNPASGAGAGPVDLLGLDEARLLAARLRGDQIGFVFQREGLFPDRDALQNVIWPLTVRGISARDATARGHALLAQTGLAPDRRVATLSGGERKRLALARALALDPPTLLLDEPFTGLDPSALDGLRELIASLRADSRRTIVLVTHQRGDIERLAEHVVLLRAGGVEAAGDLDAVREPLAHYLGANP